MNIYFKGKNFLRRVGGGKRATKVAWNQVQLISIHIPKTAGTSFFHTLKEEYGKNKLVRIDIPTPPNIRLNKISLAKAFVDPRPKVIHGHFTIAELKEQFDISKDTPIITWLRDPVERVISNYFYLSKMLEKEMKKSEKAQKLLPRMRKSLLEYASLQENQNRMHKFLQGLNLKDFLFVGLVEHYNEDVQQLGKKLNWKNLKIVQHNTTGSKNKSPVDASTRALIKSYNQLDGELYEGVLQLRKDYS